MFDWVSQKIAQKLCNHKYGEVKDGYQYCEYCNLARKVPEFTKNSGTCTHPKWEVVEAYKLQQVDRRDGSKTTTGEVRILRCERCGDFKEFRVDVTKDAME